MRRPHRRSTIHSVIAILSAACFLSMTPASFSRAVAAESWETWPKKTIAPGGAQNPEPDADRAAETWEIWPKNTDAKRASAEMELEEKKPAKATSSGKKWWIAAGTALVVGIAVAIAAGGGGSGGGGGAPANPGHQ